MIQSHWISTYDEKTKTVQIGTKMESREVPASGVVNKMLRRKTVLETRSVPINEIHEFQECRLTGRVDIKRFDQDIRSYLNALNRKGFTIVGVIPVHSFVRSGPAAHVRHPHPIDDDHVDEIPLPVLRGVLIYFDDHQSKETE